MIEDEDGNEMVLAYLNKGQFFGEMGLFYDEPARSAWVRTRAASEIAARVAEEGFESLRKPIQRVTTPDVHIPFSPALEKPLYPDETAIVAAVKNIR